MDNLPDDIRKKIITYADNIIQKSTEVINHLNIVIEESKRVTDTSAPEIIEKANKSAADAAKTAETAVDEAFTTAVDLLENSATKAADAVEATKAAADVVNEANPENYAQAQYMYNIVHEVKKIAKYAETKAKDLKGNTAEALKGNTAKNLKNNSANELINYVKDLVNTATNAVNTVNKAVRLVKKIKGISKDKIDIVKKASDATAVSKTIAIAISKVIDIPLIYLIILFQKTKPIAISNTAQNTDTDTTIEQCEEAITIAESVIENIQLLKKMLQTYDEVLLDTKNYQNSSFSEISKFFLHSDDINNNGKNAPQTISTEKNTTYMYGVLPNKKEIDECNKEDKDIKECIKKLQNENYMDEYTVRTVKQDGLMVPWGIEMYFNMLLNTSSNISFKDVYYDNDKDGQRKPNPVYTHNMKKQQVKNTKGILF